MSEKKTQQLLQLFYRESARVRLLDLDALPAPDGEEQLALNDWLTTKRQFSSDEITTQHWIKTCCAGYITEVKLHPDGSLEEYTLFNRLPTTGNWQLVDGAIELSIFKGDNHYRSVVFANKNSSIHSAIEYKNGELHAYLKLAQTRPLPA
ncbi:hypothetical protein C9I98_07180 [Photobacterium sanctipauli]|uniref:Uncharacterized protein n=1 Tax=Photobacterium sanctipauli TaxID=1342794 RepID=A0A2T3NWJ2_9GAMM|nr:hypothetical protein [Photobacterium sanctipauli]PSW20625.1 hypothetical protein C9I98_07180 [Photobacterium sanctipauli]